MSRTICKQVCSTPRGLARASQRHSRPPEPQASGASVSASGPQPAGPRCSCPVLLRQPPGSLMHCSPSSAPRACRGQPSDPCTRPVVSRRTSHKRATPWWCRTQVPGPRAGGKPSWSSSRRRRRTLAFVRGSRALPASPACLAWRTRACQPVVNGGLRARKLGIPTAPVCTARGCRVVATAKTAGCELLDLGVASQVALHAACPDILAKGAVSESPMRRLGEHLHLASALPAS